MTHGLSPPSTADGADDRHERSGASGARGHVTVVICRSCRLPADPHLDPRPGSILAARMAEAGRAAGVTVAQADCLANCRRGLSAAILRTGSWSYVFGELTPDSAGDLIAGAKLFAGSPDGLMPFRGRPDALKRGLIARVPPLESLKDLP